MADGAEHVHHWRIAAPGGPTSTAFCLGCDDVREFSNSEIRTGPWEAVRDRNHLKMMASQLTLGPQMIEEGYRE